MCGRVYLKVGLFGNPPPRGVPPLCNRASTSPGVVKGHLRSLSLSLSLSRSHSVPSCSSPPGLHPHSPALTSDALWVCLRARSPSSLLQPSGPRTSHSHEDAVLLHSTLSLHRTSRGVHEQGPPTSVGKNANQVVYCRLQLPRSES